MDIRLEELKKKQQFIRIEERSESIKPENFMPLHLKDKGFLNPRGL